MLKNDAGARSHAGRTPRSGTRNAFAGPDAKRSSYEPGAIGGTEYVSDRNSIVPGICSHIVNIPSPVRDPITT
jgi:hypothetical protein